MVLFRHRSIPRFCVTLQDDGSHILNGYIGRLVLVPSLCFAVAVK